MKKILIACERSGIVRKAFADVGFLATSVDLKPTDTPLGARESHFIMDALTAAYCYEWDGMIGHPECKYLCNSGVRWLTDPRGNNAEIRKHNMKLAREFFMELWNAPIEHICLENPIPHKYAELPNYSQIIHPWQFGHVDKKATCLWLYNLPKLTPTKIIPKELRKPTIHHMPPSRERSYLRAKTFEGIAKAMANQWKNAI